MVLGNKTSGFTLVELLIVIGIIAILATIAIPNFLEAQIRAKVARVQADMRTLATGLESYYVDNNNYVFSADSVGVGADFLIGRSPTASVEVTGVLAEDGSTALVECGGFFKKLSTPVAYLSTAFIQDPFYANQYGRKNDVWEQPYRYIRYTVFNDYRPIAWHGWPGRNAQGEIVADDERGRPENNNPHYLNDARQSPLIQAWVLWSLGPDLREGAWVEDEGKTVFWEMQDYLVGMEKRDDPDTCYDQWLAQMYDPTNGTVSGGNVMRIGGLKPKPDFYDTSPAIEGSTITQTQHYGAYRLFHVFYGKGANTRDVTFLINYNRSKSGSEIGWVDENGENLIELTDDIPANSCRGAYISPDEEKILYHFNDAGTWKIFVMDKNGANKRYVFTIPPTPYTRGPVGWLDNNTVLYIHENYPASTKLYAVGLDGGNNRVLIDPADFSEGTSVMEPVVSSGGDIVFASQDGAWSPRFDILVANSDGSNPRTFYAEDGDNHTDVTCFWSLDGNTVYWSHFVNPGVGVHNFSIYYKALGNREPVNSHDDVLISGLHNHQHSITKVLSPNGEKVLVQEYNGNTVYTLDLRDGAMEYKLTWPSDLGNTYPRHWTNATITLPDD